MTIYREACLPFSLACSIVLSACGGGGSAASPTGQSDSSAQSVTVAAAPALATAGTVSALAVGGATATEAKSAVIANTSPKLIVRARGDLAGGIGPIIEIRIDGTVIGSVEVATTSMQDYSFDVPSLKAGSLVDIAYINDGGDSAGDRNLYVAFVQSGNAMVLPNDANVRFDRGAGYTAFDGVDTMAGRSDIYWNGALRITWPATAETVAAADKAAAARFLMQATFGPTRNDITGLLSTSYSSWIDAQIAMPATSDYVDNVQFKFNLGSSYLPDSPMRASGSNYLPNWPVETFWKTAVTGQDQLRRRVAFALQQIFVISVANNTLWSHPRAAAGYLDTLNKDALGNYRTLLEDVALSPAMGIYLSHIRNQKEDPTRNRLPDENFAREVMQLFTIGLHELNSDGTAKLDGSGNPIETYNNADVAAMARVFTGWSWGLDDGLRTEQNFLSWYPDYSATGANRVDLRPMRSYASQHSMAEKRLFAGKPYGVTIPANTAGPESLRIALDTLFQHPNVAPFISAQLIQKLVTSNPTPAYVGRVAAVFANNGKGVRGDLGAVVKAVLLDPEARSAPDGNFGKLREPVLRVTHWMRAFGATSASGRWTLGNELVNVSERPLNAPTVFNFYRPRYMPPNGATAAKGLIAPEFQIADESTVASWINQAEAMITDGIGWNGSGKDVTAAMTDAIPIAADPAALVDYMNLMLFSGRMSASLRANIIEGVVRVNTGNTRDRDRARVAAFLSLASPEYLIDR